MKLLAHVHVLTEIRSTFVICIVLMAVRVQMVLIMMEKSVWLKKNALVSIIQKYFQPDPLYKLIVTNGKLYLIYKTVGALESCI